MEYKNRQRLANARRRFMGAKHYRKKREQRGLEFRKMKAEGIYEEVPNESH